VPLLEAAVEAVGLGAADVEPGDDGWRPDEAHPAAAAAQMSAAAARASRPDLGTPAPRNTVVPFMCATPRAPPGKYDGNAPTLVGPGVVSGRA